MRLRCKRMSSWEEERKKSEDKVSLLCDENLDSLFQQSCGSSSVNIELVLESPCSSNLSSECVIQSYNFLWEDSPFKESRPPAQNLDSGYLCLNSSAPCDYYNVMLPSLETPESAEGSHSISSCATSALQSCTKFLTCSQGLSEKNCSASQEEIMAFEEVAGAYSMDSCGKHEISVLEFRESMANLIQKEYSGLYRPSKVYIGGLKGNQSGICSEERQSPQAAALRRKCVLQIFKLKEELQLSILIAARGIDLLDKFLSTQSLLSVLSCMHFPEESLLKMELTVLKSIGWFAVTVTALDFLGNIIDHLPLLGVPQCLMRRILDRADELVQGILPEVEIMVYQPSIISMCVIQCILDEYVPLQATSHIAALQKAMAIDMDEMQSCYQILVDLVVDPCCNYALPSPSYVAEMNNKALSTLGNSALSISLF
ncbi:hypothetical protein O6H91_12G087800 [Diphasiastrum complanatum]|uniref:Uncharacterized protein n=1 Tax=Diphasiastrum complanatum TaxID=34168 RepID=A0ACC2C4I1_DIPCM|nr:hypothetical protein O6H91_12G087800 [Diphasiastrum complanatum]